MGVAQEGGCDRSAPTRASGSWQTYVLQVRPTGVRLLVDGKELGK